MARTARAGAVAAPRPVRRPRTRVAPPRAVPRAVRARGESLLDALLQGRAWIALVGLLLVGIVFFNVDLLRLNRSIAVTSEQAEGVSRENARLRLELARLGSSERVQKAALQRGLVLPAPGDVRFRDVGKRDGRRALSNLRAPKRDESAPTPGQTTAQVPQTTTPQTVTPQVATPPAATPVTPQVTAPQPTTPPAVTPAPVPAPVATPGAG